MKLGYARVSTQDQDNQAQIDALTAAGVKPKYLFCEKESGGRWDRPELHKLLDQLREGDTLVVYKLDRLSRSLKDLIFLLEKIEGMGAHFQSLTESIDTSTPAGRLMMHIVGSFAEFERAMLQERTRAGLESARRNGRIGGRRPKLNDEQERELVKMVNSNEKTAADAARLFRVHRSTATRIIERHQSQGEEEP